MVALPVSKAFGEDERSVLLGYLAYHRAVLARKLDGVTDDDGCRAACAPSTLTLTGLVRHMTDVERWWFRMVAQDEALEGRFDEDAEWDVSSRPTVKATLADFWEEIEIVDGYLATADLDARMPGGPDPGVHSLRRTIVHMIEEYARHCGHADLLREAIDGSTGD
jgi:hypothetical protein